MTPRPKKRFSQNFLIDNNIASKIVSYLNIKNGETIFEIGPGRGVLTNLIAQTGAKLFAFELDRSLMDDLNRQLSKCENVTIINQDFLTVDPSDHTNKHFKLIGNIPYDITSPLLDWIIKYRTVIDCAVITAQKELADRISSGPGSKNWAAISILAQTAYDIKSQMTIKPESFYPPPKVKSSTLVFTPIDRYKIPDYDFFKRLVKTAFTQRRKLLINNLAEYFECDKNKLELALETLGWDRKIRAEQVSIDDFIRLAELLSALKIS